jgi:peptide/nickel transport system substrate-binding protein
MFRTIPDTDSQMAALMTHDIDWMWSVLPENMKQLSAVPTAKVTPAPTMRMSFLSLDASGITGDTPLKKLKVRQAIAHAINRESIAKDLVGPGAEVLRSICSPSQFGCSEDVPQYSYDPALAKKLLAEAGYPDGFEMRFYGYRDRPYSEAVANYLRAVGIRTDLQFLQFNALLPKIRKAEIPLSQLTWASYSLPDASISVGNYFEFSGDDLARDKQVRDWLVAADHTIEPEERKSLYKKALTRIAEQAYFIPVVKYGRIYATNADLDIKITPDELGHFYMARWK